jgi:hypothetical protein
MERGVQRSKQLFVAKMATVTRKRERVKRKKVNEIILLN